ncbi:MAG: RDD family protein [Bdellovibrio sp.]
MNHSSLMDRYFAYLIDSIIILTVTAAFKVLFVKFFPDISGPLYFISLITFFYFYIIKAIKRTGQTLGKKILGIQIVFDTIEPSVFEVIMREFVWKTISAAFLFLGLVWALFDSKKQTWHDKLARTEVITLGNIEEQSEHSFVKWLSILGLPGLLSCILYVFLFTSAPLNSLHKQLELAGLKMDTMDGSIVTGIKVSNLEGDFDSLGIKLATVTFKIDFLESITNKSLVIANATAENGFINYKTSNEKPLPTASKQMGQDAKPIPNEAAGESKFKLFVTLYSLKNINFKKDNETLLNLHSFEIKSLEASTKKLAFEKIEISTEKGMLSLEGGSIDDDLKKYSLDNVSGYLTPEFSQLIKKKTNFSFQAKNKDNDLKISGSFGNAKIVGSLDKEKSDLKISDSDAGETLELGLPIDKYNLSLKKEGNGLPSFDADLTLCKKSFSFNGLIFIHGNAGKTFYIKQNLPELLNALSLKTAADKKTNSNAPAPILYLTADANNGSYFSKEEIASDFCYGKKTSQLSPAELVVVKEMSKAVQLPEPALLPKFSQTMIGLNSNLDFFQSSYNKSKYLFRLGKTQEALDIIKNVKMPSAIPLEQQIAFMRHISWLNLVSGDAKKSASLFIALYSQTKSIADAEGALKSYTKMGDSKSAKLWLGQIEAMLVADPKEAQKLSPNFRRSIASIR